MHLAVFPRPHYFIKQDGFAPVSFESNRKDPLCLNIITTKLATASLNKYMNFKTFLEQNSKEENKSVKEALQKLPKAYRNLVKGFKFKFLDGSTLHGDSEHVGYMTNKPKVIAVAGPWHYGREFTFFHEVAHLVWEQLVDKDKRKAWGKVLAATKDKRQHQGEEEMFCMAFANFYAKNKIVIHDHETWKEFIKGLAK